MTDFKSYIHSFSFIHTPRESLESSGRRSLDLLDTVGPAGSSIAPKRRMLEVNNVFRKIPTLKQVAPSKG